MATDKEIAGEVYSAVRGLNHVLEKAAKAGLTVEIGQFKRQLIGQEGSILILRETIERREVIKSAE